MKKICTAFFF